MTFALLNLCLVGFAHPARAEGPRHAAMVIDANTGKVLHAANADVPRYPASLTKLMTLYLVFETLETGALQLDSPILVSEAAASVAPSKLELAPGETIELADAIKALVTKSANDMAVAIAEKISGSERAFAELMTKRARQIGMNSTTFRNASGLPDMQQQTTARDMLTLALRIYDDFPDRARVFSLREFTFRGKTYRTHNTLMKSFAGMNGMKTGYTSASGFNLVASVRRDGKNLVAAVFGGATASSRNAHMRQILNQALEDAATEKTRVSRPQLIASVRPAARPQNDGARPQNDGARPQKTQPTATWPQAKVATAAPAPTPAARPSVKTVETAKPAAIVKPVAPALTAVSIAPPAVAVQAAGPVPAAVATDIPAQTVSVSPPITVATVHTIPIVPMPAATGATAAATTKIADTGVITGATGTTGQAVSVTPPAVTASAAPKLDFEALRRAISAPSNATAAPSEAPGSAPAATAPPRDDETIIAKAAPTLAAVAPMVSATVRPPSTLNAQVAQLGPTASLPATPARPPSTLGAQAVAVAQTDSATAPTEQEQPMGLSGPARATSLVQIGAYSSQQEAERQLTAVQARAQATLSGVSPIAHRIETGGRSLYAARFAGFDQAAASKACLELRQQSIDCFVVQAK